MRRAARIDANHRAIVEALRAAGASVASTAGVGNGFPDLVVGYRKVNYLLEVKDGARRPSERRLTSAEFEFHAGWRGQAMVVESAVEALQVIGAMK